MNKLFIVLTLIITSAILISCATTKATTVEIQFEYPPHIDLSTVQTITVVIPPAEWGVKGRYVYLEKYITQALADGIRKAKIYEYIPFAEGVNADIQITWRLIDVTTDDEDEEREEHGKKNKVTYTTRTVTVKIEYSFFDPINNEVLRVINSESSASETFKKNKSYLLDILFDTSSRETIKQEEKIAIAAVKKFSGQMNTELVPRERTEKRSIMEDQKNDPRLTEAKSLVRKKKYPEALNLYKNIYEETGGVAAGYNTALLLEANGQFADALALLKDLNNRIEQSGKNRLYTIEVEIRNLEKYINESKILEAYKR